MDVGLRRVPAAPIPDLGGQRPLLPLRSHPRTLPSKSPPTAACPLCLYLLITRLLDRKYRSIYCAGFLPDFFSAILVFINCSRNLCVICTSWLQFLCRFRLGFSL
jgi:hypothetical protein